MPTRSTVTRRNLLHACAAGALLVAATGCFAQAYPSRPVTLIVPWPAGGSTDRHLRGLAEIASKYLGQNIVVENKPGGGGTIGPSQMALSAKPDGYTISQFPLGMLRIPHMQKSPWNPLTDFSLHHRRHRLHLRPDGARRLALQELQRIHRGRAQGSRARSTTPPPASAPRRT